MCSGYDRTMSRPAPAELLRRSPLADRVRAERLIAVLRRIEPQEQLLASSMTSWATASASSRSRSMRRLPPATCAQCAPDSRRPADGTVAVGAGTVTSAADLDAAIEAGAIFAVSPVFDPVLLERSVRAGLPFIPGAYSPTEIAGAWAPGPPSSSCSRLVPRPEPRARAARPVPAIEAIATGGIDAANAPAFLDAGRVAVGIGGSLTRAPGEDRRSLISSVRGGRRPTLRPRRC